jgi:hypothetical protein
MIPLPALVVFAGNPHFEPVPAVLPAFLLAATNDRLLVATLSLVALSHVAG